MIIVGCDYHPSFQQIAYVDTETGEWKERLDAQHILQLLLKWKTETCGNCCGTGTAWCRHARAS
jgi:hypothetical protein